MSDVGAFRTTILIENVERRGETRAVETSSCSPRLTIW